MKKHLKKPIKHNLAKGPDKNTNFGDVVDIGQAVADYHSTRGKKAFTKAVFRGKVK